MDGARCSGLLTRALALLFFYKLSIEPARMQPALHPDSLQWCVTGSGNKQVTAIVSLQHVSFSIEGLISAFDWPIVPDARISQVSVWAHFGMFVGLVIGLLGCFLLLIFLISPQTLPAASTHACSLPHLAKHFYRVSLEVQKLP